MAMSDTKLRHCPFCKSSDIDLECDEFTAHMVCFNCGAAGPTVNRTYVRAETLKNASDAWNKRAGDADE